jgi:hypothetical protein
MSFQRPPHYANPLQLIAVLIIMLLGTTSIVLAAPLATCANDRKRLCGTLIGNPSAMQKCMKAHRTEWSGGCAAAAASRRAKCAEYVQLKNLPQNGGKAMEHRSAAPAALDRCMQGEAMD